ncbi:MAG: hypothetical protein IT258_15070 [Saprospiraceae bacterium]|nr:hypothetical protein [Saprospiraceae bacterium]
MKALKSFNSLLFSTKKVFCSLFFALGMFISANAQDLYVDVSNNTNGTWNVTVTDANNQSQTVSVTVGNSANFTITNFDFPLTVTASLNGANCPLNATIQGAGSGGGSIFCSPDVDFARWEYDCSQTSSGGDHVLKLGF